MTESEKLDIQIDRYLAGEMTSSEKTQFELGMKADQQLANQVNLRREMTNFFRRDGDSLLEKLEKAGDKHLTDTTKPKRRGTLVLFLAALLFLATLMVYLLNARSGKLPEKSAVAPARDSLLLEPNKAPEPSESPVILPPDTADDLSPVPEKRTTTKEVERAVEKPLTSPPVAAIDPADFQPNPYLEALLADELRSTVDLSIYRPKAADTLALSWNKSLQINGTISEKLPLRYVVFDNDETRFIDDQPLESGALKLTEQDNGFSFNTSLRKELKSGRYYLLILNAESEAVLDIRLFFVQ